MVLRRDDGRVQRPGAVVMAADKRGRLSLHVSMAPRRFRPGAWVLVLTTPGASTQVLVPGPTVRRWARVFINGVWG